MSSETIRRFEESSPGRRLAMLHRLGMALLSGPLAELGISRGQIGFLASVLQHEGIIQEELSKRLYIDRAATARALRDMEDQGWVVREEDPEDRRRKRVYPTDKARAVKDPLIALLSKNNKALFAGLSPAEQAQFLAMLDRLVDNLRTALEAC